MLDPTVQVLLTIFGGALLTAIAGSVGALVAWRREQHKWLRDRRMESYAAALSAIDSAVGRAAWIEELSSRRTELSDDAAALDGLVDAAAASVGPSMLRAGEAVSAAYLLGPQSVADLLYEEMDLMQDPSALWQHRAEVVSAMRDALRIRS